MVDKFLERRSHLTEDLWLKCVTRVRQKRQDPETHYGTTSTENVLCSHVAGAWTERKKMFLGGSFLKLADDDV